MKPISTWPLISAVTTLAAAVVTAVASVTDDDDGHPIPRLTTKSIEQAAYFGCTDEEIANLFVISESYLLNRYSLNLAFIRAMAAYDLRKAQFNLATKKGNATMLGWLGRNYLNQSLAPGKETEAAPNFEAKVG